MLFGRMRSRQFRLVIGLTMFCLLFSDVSCVAIGLRGRPEGRENQLSTTLPRPARMGSRSSRRTLKRPVPLGGNAPLPPLGLARRVLGRISLRKKLFLTFLVSPVEFTFGAIFAGKTGTGRAPRALQSGRAFSRLLKRSAVHLSKRSWPTPAAGPLPRACDDTTRSRTRTRRALPSRPAPTVTGCSTRRRTAP